MTPDAMLVLRVRRLAAKEIASQLRAVARQRDRDCAAALVGSGLCYRDVGFLMGVTHQRVHQLVKGV